MDVTCDRCSTEYEFEEALVSPRGTTVKCTQCGHLFKVFRAEPALPAQLPGTHWTVRGADGSIHELANLSELTDLIRAGTFTRDDEVSRTGKAWRRLGDVEELEEFFLEADRRGPSRGFPPTDAALDGERTEPLPPFDTAADEPEAPSDRDPTETLRRDEPTVLAVQPPAADDEDDEALTVQRPLPGRGSNAPAARGAIDQAPNTPNAPRSRPRFAPLAAANEPQFTPQIAFPELDENDHELSRPRRSAWPWVAATASALAGLAFWFFSPAPALPPPKPQPAVAATEDLSRQYLARADQAFAAHRAERFEQAITDYIKALAFHDSDAHILSSLSRVYAVWAQELTFSLDAGKGRADNDPARRSERQMLQNQIQALSDQAKNYAESAARKNPGNAEAEVALSDALRLTGSLVAARAELDRARATDHHPSAETLRVSALLASAEAGGDLRKGLSFASQAVSRDPELLRCRLLLARCLIAEGDIQGARYQLHEVTVRDREHPSVLAIQQMLAERPPEPVAAEEPPPKPVVDAPPTPLDNLSHESCVSRGQAFLESGQVMLAKRMFEQALFLRPNSSAAHTGMGYVALEKGRPQLAAEHFLAAARAGNEDALIGLADAYRRLGRPRDALRSYQNYLNRFPNGKQISIARAQVERLTEELAARRKD